MKIKFNILITMLLGGTLLFLTTCKQTDNNPCAGAKEPTAAFTMMETTSFPPYYNFETYDTDTASPGMIQFTALEPNAKYEWKVGTDTLVYTKQQFTLDFSNYYTQYQPNVPPVTVILKVIKAPGSCFPASDSVKYMTRTLYLTTKTLIQGSFSGKFNYDQTTKVVSISKDTVINDPQTGVPINVIYFYGLPNKETLFGATNKDSLFLEDETLFYYRKGFIYYPFANILLGEIMVTPDNNHIFIWIKQNNPNIPSTYSFTGTRI